ncbi:MAG: type I-B CRISPR-associated protein Cas8b/Csh1, partial [Eubacterium ventriosum]
KGIQRVLHLVSMNIIKSSITNGYMGKAANQYNLMKSLDMYLGGNDMENIKDIEDSYIDIRNTLSKKINQQKHSHIESKKEYYYAVGQLVRYYISLNKSKDKYHSLSNPFINATSDDVIKSKLKQFYKKYNYAIKVNNNRYNNLYQMIISYIPSGKVISDDIIAGYISNNLIYESKKLEEEN